MTLSNVMELHRRSGGRSRNFRTGKGGGAGVVAFVGERGADGSVLDPPFTSGDHNNEAFFI